MRLGPVDLLPRFGVCDRGDALHVVDGNQTGDVLHVLPPGRGLTFGHRADDLPPEELVEVAQALAPDTGDADSELLVQSPVAHELDCLPDRLGTKGGRRPDRSSEHRGGRGAHEQDHERRLYVLK